MMDGKFWDGVVRALNDEMHIKHRPHGALQFPVHNFKITATIQDEDLIDIQPFDILTVDWSQNSAYYKYFIRFTYPKWEKGKYYSLNMTGEAVESPYFAQLLGKNIADAGLIELTEQEKHHKMLYEKQKEWIEKQQKEGWAGVKYQEAYEYFSDDKYLHKLNEYAYKTELEKKKYLKNIPIEDVESYTYKGSADFEQQMLQQAYQKFKNIENDMPPAQEWGDSGTKLLQVIPGLSHKVMDGCPHPDCDELEGHRLESIIIHLNDRHKWPRCVDDPNPRNAPNNIADWVEEYALEMHLDMTFHTVEEKDRNVSEAPF